MFIKIIIGSIYLLFLSFTSVASEIPTQFKIQCEKYGRPIAFAYDGARYSSQFLMGEGGFARTMKSMNKYDLDSIEMGKLGGGESISINFSQDFRKDEKSLWQLMYWQSGGITLHSVTLSKDGSKILSVVSQYNEIDKCVSVGIW